MNLENPIIKKLISEACFPVRLRKCDVTAPLLAAGVSSATRTAWEAKFEMVRKSVVKDGVTWLLLGKRGRGKSQLAVEVGKAVCAQERKVRYVRAAWLFVNVRSTYQAAAQQTEEEAIGGWLSPRLLIIDEIDKRKGSDAEDMLIENIVCQRHDDGKDTILVSNLTKKEAEEDLGPSIVSRMCEGGGVVECDWESWRMGN